MSYIPDVIEYLQAEGEDIVHMVMLTVNKDGDTRVFKSMRPLEMCRFMETIANHVRENPEGWDDTWK